MLPLALVLRVRPSNDEPLVGRAVEIEVARLEIEFGLPARRFEAPFLYFETNPKLAFPVAPLQKSGQASGGERIQPPPVTKPPSGL